MTHQWRSRGLIAVVAAGLMALPATSASARGPGGGGGGGGSETTVGNNLSYPVIWAHEITPLITPPGTAGVVKLDGAFAQMDGYRLYYQQDLGNSWQAPTYTNAAPNVVQVNQVDWGDNLESKDWPYRQTVRVETGMFANAFPDGTTPMAYTMGLISGAQTTEMQGLKTVPDASGVQQAVMAAAPNAFVYSSNARLTIQMVDPATADQLVYNPTSGAWTGTGAGKVYYTGSAWKAIDGPGAYVGEISVAGKVTYGYVWATKTSSGGPGEYRLTFSLAPAEVAGQAPLATMVGATILPSAETGEVSADAEPGGNTARIADGVSWIDVTLTGTRGGRR